MDERKVGKKVTLLFFLAISLTIIAPGCKSEEMTSYWTPKPKTIDGKIDDWSAIPTLSPDNFDVGLGVCNDSQNIYIVVKFRNPQWLMPIRKTGLSFWLDKQAKKKKEFGLTYNGIPESFNLEDFNNRRRGHEGPGNVPAGGDEMIAAPNMREDRPVELRLIDVNSIFKEAIIDKNGLDGPEIACDTSMSFIVYEIKVPLTESMSRNYGIGAEPGQKLSLGFIWNDMEDRRDKMKGKRPGGGMGGGRPGGGMRGGPPGGFGDRDNSTMKKQEIWVKTLLAVPAAIE